MNYLAETNNRMLDSRIVNIIGGYIEYFIQTVEDYRTVREFRRYLYAETRTGLDRSEKEEIVDNIKAIFAEQRRETLKRSLEFIVEEISK